MTVQLEVKRRLLGHNEATGEPIYETSTGPGSRRSSPGTAAFGRWMMRSSAASRYSPGLNAATSLVQVTRALGEPGQQEPDWMAELRGKLSEKARALRRLVISAAAAR
jgi:hypothetical protein